LGDLLSSLLLLLGPILTFLLVLGAEMLVDVLTTPGITPVCIVRRGGYLLGVYFARTARSPADLS
jgi:hypothetical protein